MSRTKYTEALVYASVETRSALVGGIKLDSSYDTYDVEYGWKAEDYERAGGGTGIHYYTVRIGVYSLNTEKFTEISQRFRGALITSVDGNPSDEGLQKELQGYATIDGGGDVVLFHRSGNRLLDVGKYGIVDTLTGKTLSCLVGTKDRILKYDGFSISFTKEYPAIDPPIFRINLEEGLKTGQFKAVEIPEKKKGDFKDFDKGLWRHHLVPFTVKVNDEKFTIDNQRYRDYMLINSSKIIAPDHKVIWQGDYCRYIVAATGFPETVLLEKGGKT